MKRLYYILLLGFLFSCGGDDDICLSGEATPRAKIKFKTAATGKLKTLDTLYVQVDYGDGIPVQVVNKKAKVDSLLLPLRVDESVATEIYIKTRKVENYSKIKITYTTASQYVSPACGVKKLYKNLGSSLLTTNPVVNVEQNQNEIIDENKTHFYLHF